jgi:hypothetical protein
MSRLTVITIALALVAGPVTTALAQQPSTPKDAQGQQHQHPQQPQQPGQPGQHHQHGAGGAAPSGPGGMGHGMMHGGMGQGGGMPMAMCAEMMGRRSGGGMGDLLAIPNLSGDPKTAGRMLQMRGEMLRAIADVMTKHGKELAATQP